MYFPMLGIPLYGSNKANLEKVERQGLGLVLQKSSIDKDKLLGTIRQLLNDPRYLSLSLIAIVLSLSLHAFPFQGMQKRPKMFRRRSDQGLLLPSNEL